MQNENKFSKGKISLIAFVLVMPIIISSFACYMIFGDLTEALSKMWGYRGKSNITDSSVPVTSLSYIFTILIAFYALCATSYFSFLVWRVSKGSLSVSQQLQELEKNRDEEIVRENALIVYYDLQRGISNFRDLYISYVLNGVEAKPNRIYFSADWIKNVANLRDDLTSQELNRVYKLYEQFYALQNILEEHKVDKPNEELREYLEELSKEVFADFIPVQLLDKLKVSSVDELVSIDLYIILQKIYSSTYISSKRKPKERKVNGKSVYETYLNGVLFFVGDTKEAFVGDGELYNTNGKIKCSGQFESKKFIKGTVYGYYDSTKKCYEITYDKEIKKGTLYKLTNDTNQYFYNGEFHNGEIISGITTLFHKNKEISYQGDIKDGLKSGKGIFYNEKGQLIFDGTWKEDFYFKGISFKEDKEIFNGEYKIINKEPKPWNGTATKYDLSYIVKQFTGEICEGKPITGKGFIYKVNSRGESLEDLIGDEKHQIEQAEARAEEVPDPVQLEDEALIHNNNIRRGMRDITEYIKAQWSEGSVTEEENKEINIEIYNTHGVRIEQWY
ncbi:toxin-antitoxin system YwqK family antitoxin [Bacillus pseudomycoides]|uniref:toxin-antitoxin system YwqK family antitoxin n=1 Tax=Bacillus pseudomycoides TaxID=64104 RepID=UPI000BFA0694|nr:hypothetical protein [Bacillus pseudomycoides]PFW91277.1 hypothetical protein COL29_19205 [Bacillus pseudomycoides]